MGPSPVLGGWGGGGGGLTGESVGSGSQPCIRGVRGGGLTGESVGSGSQPCIRGVRGRGGGVNRGVCRQWVPALY